MHTNAKSTGALSLFVVRLYHRTKTEQLQGQGMSTRHADGLDRSSLAGTVPSTSALQQHAPGPTSLGGAMPAQPSLLFVDRLLVTACESFTAPNDWPRCVFVKLGQPPRPWHKWQIADAAGHAALETRLQSNANAIRGGI
ncbi:hypothetical protein PHYPSEUDO_001809 [Phytophthora pseudosyringae]|uniref:Uncharacterized protein n=1 Tax=Phytophthora pseudosyringae TaxID=221518 RepID=A0A8T1VVD3_9STRA|nr:hypothetical protein PHYPSEUDO_001809 [Phytophthora pseudosyringae]